MAHQEVQTGSLPFLSQAPPPAWIQVVEVASNQGALNMTAQLQEITMRRHRRMAGLLPARNKMLGPHRVIAFFSTSTDAVWAWCPGQSDGGEKNKENQSKPKTSKPQPTGRVSTIL